MRVSTASSPRILADNHPAVFTEQIKAISGSKLTIEDTPGEGNLHFIQLVFQGQFEATLTCHDAAASMIDGEF